METILGLVVAFITSLVVSIIYHSRSASGTLKIDRHNPEKDIYRLDIDDLDNLAKKKRIVLNIDPNADLSQE